MKLNCWAAARDGQNEPVLETTGVTVVTRSYGIPPNPVSGGGGGTAGALFPALNCWKTRPVGSSVQRKYEFRSNTTNGWMLGGMQGCAKRKPKGCDRLPCMTMLPFSSMPPSITMTDPGHPLPATQNWCHFPVDAS